MWTEGGYLAPSLTVQQRPDKCLNMAAFASDDSKLCCSMANLFLPVCIMLPFASWLPHRGPSFHLIHRWVLRTASKPYPSLQNKELHVTSETPSDFSAFCVWMWVHFPLPQNGSGLKLFVTS